MHVDVGVYGHSKLKNYVGREKALKSFEKFTLEHKGYQALYAETFMTYEDFTNMFPRIQYDLVNIKRENVFFFKYFLQARRKFSGTLEAFPEVYEKVSRIGRERRADKEA